MTTCTTCGQVINEVVIIDGLPYGTTCAENKLGIRQFPSWFKGGDWNKAKDDYDKGQAANKAIFENSRLITSRTWSEWVMLSKAFKREYAKQNDWAANFISSIIRQLGYPSTLAETKWQSMEDAEKNWSPASGTFLYLYNEPRKIDTLSPKQLSILDKFISNH